MSFRSSIAFILSMLVRIALMANADAADNSEAAVLSNAELIRHTKAGIGRIFEITGTVLADDFTAGLVIEDHTGILQFSNRHDFKTKTGDLVKVNGYTYLDKRGRPWIEIEDALVLGRGKTTPPTPANVTDTVRGVFDNRFIRIKGRVADVIFDEIDDDVIFFFLSDNQRTITVACGKTGFDDKSIRKLINAEISVVGFCTPNLGALRRFQTRGIISSARNITTLTPAPPDPFNVPEISTATTADADCAGSLSRRRLDGTVLACRNGNAFLLATTNRCFVTVSLSEQNNLPKVGSFVRIAGFPDTDMYNLHFTRSIWKMQAGEALSPAVPVEATADEIASFGPNLQYNFYFHGKTVKITGTIRHIFKSDGKISLMIENGRHIVTVNASASPDSSAGISVGCVIAATGVCIMDVDIYRPNLPLTKIRGFSIVTRDNGDIKILSKPSWWTVGRLSALCVFLILSFIVIAVWNRFLQRLVDRRGRELFRSNIDKVSAELKADERTRLAVELHDALSQSLTGVSLQLDAAKRFKNENRRRMSQHLDFAMRALKSCRDELRNCLWDLRNRALDEKDLNEAIRRTISPFTGEAKLLIRFNVPRESLSQNTAYALIRIIRELATNAVRHGAARTIRIAGAFENGRLRFSVSDDGTGFDSDNRPGVSDGHFGLEGIRERIGRLNGEMGITTVPGKGTSVSISIDA